MLAWTIVAALAVAPPTQSYDNAEAARASAELQAIVKAQGRIDLSALKSLDAQAARITRCNAIMTQIDTLEGAKQARWAKIAGALPRAKLADPLLRDFTTAQTLTPDGRREAALRRDHAACMNVGLATMPEAARTCTMLEQPIADFRLAKEQRWLVYRGPMPERFADTAAFAAYSHQWHDKRDAFEATEVGSADQAKLADLERRQHRACSAVPATGRFGSFP